MSTLLLSLQDDLAPVYLKKKFSSNALVSTWQQGSHGVQCPMSLHDRLCLCGFCLGSKTCMLPLMAFYMGGPAINWQLIQGVTPNPVRSTVHLCSQQSLLHAGINRASGWLQQSAQLTLTLPSHFTITDSLVSCFANSWLAWLNIIDVGVRPGLVTWRLVSLGSSTCEFTHLGLLHGLDDER